MKIISGKRMCKVLDEHGCILKNIRGSHYVYYEPKTKVNISVPVHGNRDLKPGLQRHIMKLAGIKESDL